MARGTAPWQAIAKAPMFWFLDGGQLADIGVIGCTVGFPQCRCCLFCFPLALQVSAPLLASPCTRLPAAAPPRIVLGAAERLSPDIRNCWWAVP